MRLKIVALFALRFARLTFCLGGSSRGDARRPPHFLDDVVCDCRAGLH